MSCGCTPTVCLATGIVNLYTVISSPASSGSAEFLWVLFYHMVQNLRDGVTPAGSRLVHVLNRNEGLVCILFKLVGRGLRDEVTLWVETVLGLILGRNEDFSDFLFGWFRAFAMGVTLWRVEFATWSYALDRNEGLFSEPYSKILRDEVTHWVECVPRYTLDHERRIYLVVSPRSFRMGSPI